MAEWLQWLWQSLYELSASAGGITVFVLLSALVFFMMLVAIAGSVVPVLPGPFFAFLGVVILKLTIAASALSWFGVFLCLAITLVSAVLDYALPVKYTPTRAGSWGAFFGVFVGFAVGMFFPPLAIPAIFLGPLLCAFGFEYASNSSFKTAWQSGKGAFWGTVAGILARVAAIFAMIIVCAADIAL